HDAAKPSGVRLLRRPPGRLSGRQAKKVTVSSPACGLALPAKPQAVNSFLSQNTQPTIVAGLIGSARKDALINARQPIAGIGVVRLEVLLRTDEISNDLWTGGAMGHGIDPTRHLAGAGCPAQVLPVIVLYDEIVVLLAGDEILGHAGSRDAGGQRLHP